MQASGMVTRWRCLAPLKSQGPVPDTDRMPITHRRSAGARAASRRRRAQLLLLVVALAALELLLPAEASAKRRVRWWTTTTTAPSTTTTSTTTSSTTTTVPRNSTGSSSFVDANGTSLTLDGAPYRFTGVNAYGLATDHSVSYGCGNMTHDAELDAFFASLRPNSMVRLWAFQRQVYNRYTRQLDFSPLDRVINAAARRNQRVILTLANQWPQCDDGYEKNEAWYAGGYRVAASTDGASPLSYWEYVRRIVPRYATSPTVGMWELVNEPEARIRNADGSPGCTSTGPATLRSFFDVVGGEVHRLDPNHLISSGVTGSGQCGAQGDYYESLHASSGIDVASYHDYLYDTQPMPGDAWNGLQVRLGQAGRVNKPLIVGEAGILASDSVGGCWTTAQRRDLFRAKLDAQFAAGIDGFLPWAWELLTPAACTYDIVAGRDATLALLHEYPL